MAEYLNFEGLQQYHNSVKAALDNKVDNTALSDYVTFGEISDAIDSDFIVSDTYANFVANPSGEKELIPFPYRINVSELGSTIFAKNTEDTKGYVYIKVEYPEKSQYIKLPQVEGYIFGNPHLLNSTYEDNGYQFAIQVFSNSGLIPDTGYIPTVPASEEEDIEYFFRILGYHIDVPYKVYLAFPKAELALKNSSEGFKYIKEQQHSVRIGTATPPPIFVTNPAYELSEDHMSAYEVTVADDSSEINRNIFKMEMGFNEGLKLWALCSEGGRSSLVLDGGKVNIETAKGFYHNNQAVATEKYVDDKLGDFTNLETENKDVLVNVINELVARINVLENALKAATYDETNTSVTTPRTNYVAATRTIESAGTYDSINKSIIP